jgi:hypothetical protein
VKRAIVLSPDAVRHFDKLSAREQTLLRQALFAQLSDQDATVETRNRFRLRRASNFADFELRVEDLRVFYRARTDEVQVILIGRKRGADLLIGGRKFTL